MGIPSLLLEALDDVSAAVSAARHVCVFLDFDGTLAPLAERPDNVSLPATTRTTLEMLARSPGCTVGLVSGRALEDVRTRVGIRGLLYAGNHGLEISGGGLRFVETTAIRLRGAIADAVERLEARLRGIPGVIVESKGLTASVHYRTVDSAHWRSVETIVRESIDDKHPGLRIAAGKMVWEIRPKVGWNKGTAVRWIRERLALGEPLTVYLGDDHTDEDAFAEVGKLVTARVGEAQRTQAGFRLADTDEVAQFLRWLAYELHGGQRRTAS